MKLIEINWQPTDRQLRQFGVICLFALPAIGWIWRGGSTTVALLAVIGLLFAATGMVLPSVLKPVFLALTIVATPIGMVIGELAMLLIYFAVFLPIGFVFRIAQRDALRLGLVPGSKSYWEAKRKPRDIASYYRQS